MSTLVDTLQKACVLVTLMFALGRTGFVARLTVRPARQDPLLALALFLLMALTEVWIVQQQSLMSPRFIAACAAGLLAGPWVGVAVGAGAGALASMVAHASPVVSMLALMAGGLGTGLVRQFWPALALRPSVGFAFGAATSLLPYALTMLTERPVSLSLSVELLTAGVNGAGVALLLLVVDQIRRMEAQARAAAMAEVRALQARMNPHFLFNALNTLAAMAANDAGAIPVATARIARFMRAALNQHERPLVALSEELDTVGAYLEIEQLRFGARLHVEQEVDPSVLDALVPPFLIQPLVENAVQHGARAEARQRSEAGRVRLEVRPVGEALVLIVSDNGPGIPAERRPSILEGTADGAHALALLRRRLRGLYGNAFELTVNDHPGGGTVVRVRLPRRRDEAPSAAGRGAR